MIFQDPISSLNPRRGWATSWPSRSPSGTTAPPRNGRRRVTEVLESVGLDPEVSVPKRPHEFSGGQCQRICVARALVLDPKLIICDEPVSALDVSVQAQIINLLEDMKARYGLTLVFIAHDLAVVKNISDRVAVMYLGKLCEVGSPDADLLAAGPPLHRGAARLDPRARPRSAGPRRPLSGELPSPLDPPSGCRFRTRCPRAEQLLRGGRARAAGGRPGQFVACHFPLVGRPSRPDRPRPSRPPSRPSDGRAPGRVAGAEPGPTATRLDPEVRRELILDAAEEVFEPAAAEVTFEAVADAAGVSRALVYNYFGDRSGLLAAV